MNNELNKIPPHNLEAEQSLLGSIMIDKNSFDKIADITNPDDFYKDSHRYIFETIQDLYSKHEPIDILTVANNLTERNLLEKVGSRNYLVSLSNAVPTSSHIVQYANIIKKKATLRRLQTTSQEIYGLTANEDENIDALLDQAEQKLFSISQNYTKQNFVAIKSVLGDTFTRIDELHKSEGKLRGIPTGFADMDKILSGFQKSDLIILAARPSVGKTSFALDIVRHIGAKAKVPIGIFSLEMSKEQLVDRLLSAESGIDLYKLRSGKLSDSENSDDFARLGHAMGVLSEAPIFIDDSGSLNIMELRTKCRRLKAEHNLGMIVIDYLQLMDSRANAENRLQAVSEISRSLKSIARELNVPILALSQLSRAVEMNKPAIPKLSHLRESGSIEQDADIVMFIYRKQADKNYREDELTAQDKHTAEIHISKHRNGATGIMKLFFDASKASFKNLDKNFANIAPPPQDM